jgi:hypothetical protein
MDILSCRWMRAMTREPRFCSIFCIRRMREDSMMRFLTMGAKLTSSSTTQMMFIKSIFIYLQI